MTTISSARMFVAANTARIKAPSASALNARFACVIASEHEIQRQADDIGFIADPESRLQVGKFVGGEERSDPHSLQLQFEVDVPGKVPTHAGGYAAPVAGRHARRKVGIGSRRQGG